MISTRRSVLRRYCVGRDCAERRCAERGNLHEGLLRVELNDELLADVFRYVRALGEVEKLACKLVSVHFEVREGAAAAVGSILNDDQVFTARAHFHNVARAELVARDGGHAVVHHDVAVIYKLPSLPARACKAKTEHHIVEAGLKKLQEVLAGDALLGGGLLEKVPELALKQAVGVLRLLLFLELHGVLALLAAAVVAVLARAVRLALQRLRRAEDRLAESPCEFLFGSAITGHRS